MAKVTLYIWASANVVSRGDTRRLSKRRQALICNDIPVCSPSRRLFRETERVAIELREKICDAAIRLGKLINYKSAGLSHFLLPFFHGLMGLIRYG